jgi:hypothetical protein
MGNELVVPNTGELVFLEDPAQCARVLYEIADLEQRIRDLKGALRETLFEESKLQGTKTLHFPGLDAVISTPVTTSWNYEVLLELREAGLPEERFNDLVMAETTYKVNGSVAKSIGASNDVYAEIIERAKTRVPRSPSVYVNPTKEMKEV